MDDKVYSFTQRIIAEVVDEKDTFLRKVITDYATKKSKEMGEKIEVLFIDKSVADEIINLGIREYMKK